MPRISAEHEQAVRDRIIRAAIKVFSETSYARASIQDVVRESGLSVGAVYTHFKGKEELFLVACACEAEQETDQLRLRLADLGSLSDRLRLAVDWSVDHVVGGANTKSALAHAWAQVDSSPELKTILNDRRLEMVAFARRLLDEAIATGELPAWIDAEGVAAAFVTMLEGFAIMAAEVDLIPPEEAHRQTHAFLELLLAAPAQRPATLAALAAPVEGGANRKS